MKRAAADWVLKQPWLIAEEDLAVILAIAERRNESPEAVEAMLGRPLDNTQKCVIRDGVAILPVMGPIARYADFFTEISGATAIETLAKDFRAAMDDRSVKAVILDMDTPGGTVSGVAEFAGHVRDARGTKPIVAYVGSRAQSAGYWIASAADRIVCDPTSMLGSIGVVMGMRAKKGGSDTIEFVSSQSPYKRVDPSTEGGKAHIQASLDDLADVFVDTVAANRDVDRRAVLDDFGRGGSLIGGKAVAAGMADGLGSLESVIAALAKGEMPCPPAKKPQPARKAANPPRREAMTEAEKIAAENERLLKMFESEKAARIEAERLATERATASDARHAELESRLRVQFESGILKDAQVFAESVIRPGPDQKATPAERDLLVKGYCQAALDDVSSPRAASYTLGSGDKAVTLGGSRLGGFIATQSARPALKLGSGRSLNDPVPPPTDLPPGVRSFAGEDHGQAGALTEAEKKHLDYLNATN